MAKQNVRMKAIGMGNCELHCLDNMGQLFTMVLYDVLHVPEAGRHIMSASCAAQYGFQTVLPCPNGLFRPVCTVLGRLQPR